VGAPQSGRRYKVKLASGGCGAMQSKRKELGQGVSIKSLKESYFVVELHGKTATGLSVAGRLKKGCIRARPKWPKAW